MTYPDTIRSLLRDPATAEAIGEALFLSHPIRWAPTWADAHETIKADFLKDAHAVIAALERLLAEAPSAQDTTKMSACEYCKTWRSTPCGEGCCWGIK